MLAGIWPAGTRIPAELFLTDHYRASRMTVNKAIQSLASEGLVARRPKLGTVVTARAAERPVVEIWDPADAVHRSGGHYRYGLLDWSMASDGWADITCLHRSDGRPFAFEERRINPAAAPPIDAATFIDVAPGQWLLAHVPWSVAKHGIAARGATGNVARHLALDPGEACLVLERHTWNGDLAVTAARFWYPGADHQLEGAFRPIW